MPYQWPRRILFLRHGESISNTMDEEQACAFPQGTQDYELTSRGQEQSRIAGRHLAERFRADPFDVVLTSYYLRARQTANLAFPDATVIVDERMAEYNRGMLGVLAKEDYFEHYPEEQARMRREKSFHYRPLGGENVPDMIGRARSLLQDLRLDYAGKSVILVGHARWWLGCRVALGELTVAECADLFEQHRLTPNASYALFETATGNRPVRAGADKTPWEGVLASPPPRPK